MKVWAVRVSWSQLELYYEKPKRWSDPNDTPRWIYPRTSKYLDERLARICEHNSMIFIGTILKDHGIPFPEHMKPVQMELTLTPVEEGEK